MGSHRVRFQVQQGNNQEVAVKTYNQESPCPKGLAKKLLEDLEFDASFFYRSSSEWKAKLHAAIEQAKNWIDRARAMDSSGQSQTVATFEYNGYKFRIDIEINAGAGHFG